MGSTTKYGDKRADERGAAAVEFALVVPLLLMLVFGIVDFGYMVNRVSMVNNAARDAAREGSLAGTQASITATATAALDGVLGWGFKSAMWAYSGTRTWAEDSTGATMSTIDWVTKDFPTTYISGGNGDGLTWSQSIPMAQRLDELGVDVTTLFWPAPHEPKLPHEYQFHLDLDDAQTALEKTVEFLNANTTR